MFALFGFVEAAKFRNSGEFSDCVQNVRGKVTKKKLHGVKRPRNATSFPELFPWIGDGVATRLLGTSVDRKCYAMWVAGRVRDDNMRQLRRQR